MAVGVIVLMLMPVILRAVRMAATAGLRVSMSFHVLAALPLASTLPHSRRSLSCPPSPGNITLRVIAHRLVARSLAACVCALTLTACVGPVTRVVPADVQAGDGVASVQIAEAFIGAAMPDAEIDSLATWLTPEGQTWVIASAKQVGQVFVYDGDTGDLLQRIGQPGALRRPNGVATFGDAVLVIERNGGRIQVFSLPDFEPLGSFGEGFLTLPYGLWLNETAPGDVDVYVTDSYQDGDAVPPLERLGQRVRRFRLQLDETPIRAWAIDAFGGTEEHSALRRVESIAGDAAFDRLIVSEEHPDFRHAGPLIHTLDGRYTGEHLGDGLFQGDPEGIALYDCPSGNGYWIATDQGENANRFHVFDRANLDYLGSFSGAQVRSTDGIALHPIASDRFPYGVLYVANNDAGIAAFDWRDIADALNLWLDCPE